MKRLYTIRDDAAEYYFSPFSAHTDAEASRMFIESMGEKFFNRADYKLCHIGNFDDDTGILTAVETTLVLAGLSIPADKDPTPYQPVQGVGAQNNYNSEGNSL